MEYTESYTIPHGANVGAALRGVTSAIAVQLQARVDDGRIATPCVLTVHVAAQAPAAAPPAAPSTEARRLFAKRTKED